LRGNLIDRPGCTRAGPHFLDPKLALWFPGGLCICAAAAIEARPVGGRLAACAARVAARLAFPMLGLFLRGAAAAA
jgi:hypothetical protein